MRGDYISYSGTVLDRAPQRELALRFFEFMLSDEGASIFRRCGQDPLVPADADDLSVVPVELRKYLIPGAL